MTKPEGTCSVEGCERTDVVARGWCGMHYARQRIYGRLERILPAHGMTGTPEYRAWNNASQRCLDPSHKQYAAYGGRGITICEEWRGNFVAFLRDMGPRPSPDHSIDRIDNDGPYAPENCRWATRSEQSSNRRSNRMVTFDGRTQGATQWAKEMGIAPTTVYDRLKRGWPIEDVLLRKVRRCRRA